MYSPFSAAACARAASAAAAARSSSCHARAACASSSSARRRPASACAATHACSGRAAVAYVQLQSIRCAPVPLRTIWARACSFALVSRAFRAASAAASACQQAIRCAISVPHHPGNPRTQSAIHANLPARLAHQFTSTRSALAAATAASCSSCALAKATALTSSAMAACAHTAAVAYINFRLYGLFEKTGDARCPASDVATQQQSHMPNRICTACPRVQPCHT